MNARDAADVASLVAAVADIAVACIVLAGGTTYQLNGQKLVVHRRLAIVGDTRSGEVQVDNAHRQRILELAPTASVTLKHLTLKRGKYSAIYSQGVLLVEDCTLLDGRGQSNAPGGILSSGSLVVMRSTFRGNVGSVYGGAVRATAGSLVVVASEFVSNLVQGGGYTGIGGAIGAPACPAAPPAAALAPGG